MDYQNPDTFEDLKQVNVCLGPLRKELILEVIEGKTSLTKEEVNKLINALKLAKSRMS